MNDNDNLAPTFEEYQGNPYPRFSKETLWHMSAQEFNEWRRKYDFPRIVAFIQKELKGFTRWQEEQTITTKQLTQGISQYFLEQHDCHINMRNRPAQNIYQSSNFIPFLTWLKRKKIRPNFLVYAGRLQVSYVGINPETLQKTNMTKSLKLLDLGSLNLIGLSIGEGRGISKGFKNLEFTCLDNMSMEKCFHAPYGFNFSSARNLKIKDCSFHFFSAFNTDLQGLSIENCSLQVWTLSKCSLSGFSSMSKISQSEIKSWKFYHTDFFDFFSSLKIFDSKFTFKSEDYHQYKNVKIAYTAQGEKAEAGKYYYLERRAHFNSRINYFTYNRWSLPFGTTKDGYSKFFSGVRYKFKSKEFSFFRALLDFFKYIRFRLGIVFSRKFFFHILRHYLELLFDYLDRIVRGYGEKPVRIVFTALVLLNGFALADFFIQEVEKNYLSHVYKNLLVFTGQGEFTDLTSPLLVLKIIQTLIGIFLISLFVADFSSKNRY